MIKLSDYLDIPSMSEVNRKREIEARMAEARDLWMRHYTGGRVSRLNADWVTRPTTANYELRVALQTLRARARELCRNNGVGKKFIGMVKANVVGSNGIQLQCRGRDYRGRLHKKLNAAVENAFRKWGRPGTCTASGKMSWVDAQNLFISTLIRDGEVLVRKVRDRANPFGFTLKFVDVSYLDETYNEEARNGNRIIMSVEVDAMDKPVAYYLTTPYSDGYLRNRQVKHRVRVPAEEMLHAFIVREDECEVRGVTHFHTALIDAKDLEGYKVGVITSARAAAHSFGFLKPPIDDTTGFDGTDDMNQQIELDMQPLTIQMLPPGYELMQFDPKQPTQNHPEFYRSILADVAMSLDLNYFSFAGDMSEVNYSSARVGLQTERDLWRGLQTFMIEHFCRPVFEAWLREAALSEELMISPVQFDQVKDPVWRPRGWSYVDPQKEVAANVTALEMGLTSRTDLLAEQGRDFDELLETLQEEKRKLEEAGLDFSPKPAPAQEQPVDPEDSRTILEFAAEN